MPVDLQQHYLIRHFKNLTRLAVGSLSILALLYVSGIRFMPSLPTTLHLSELLLGGYLFSVGIFVLKAVSHHPSSGGQLPVIVSAGFGLNAVFTLLNWLGMHFSLLPGTPLFWGISALTQAVWMWLSLRWWGQPHSAPRRPPLRTWFLASAISLALIHLLVGGVLNITPIALPALAGFRFWFALPGLVWLVTYFSVLRRRSPETDYFSFSIAGGSILLALGYLLESLRPAMVPYLPSPLFWGLSLTSVLILFLGLITEVVLIRNQTQTASDAVQHSQEILAEHAREIERANQALENQIVQHQIQADLNRLLTFSLANLPLKEMLHTMLGHLTTLPWLALSGEWGLYLSHASKDAFRLRYLHKLPEKWAEQFPTLTWPHCLCSTLHEPGQTRLCHALFPQTPPHPPLDYPHYGIALQTTDHEPVGHLVLLATPGSTSDAPVHAFLATVAQILVGVIQRKQAEDALRQERDKTNQYLNNAGLIFVILNPTGTIQMVNQKGCDLLGYPMFELMGKDWFTLALPERVQQEMLDMFHNLVNFGQKGMDIYFESPILTREGSERLIAWHATVIKNNDDSIQAVLASGEDITEKKRLQNQLLQAQKLESIGQLAAGIAHEINTPTQYVGDNIRFMQESFQSLSGLIRKIPGFLNAVKAQTLSPEQITELEATLKKADVDYLTEEIPKAIEQSLEGVTRVSTIVRAMKEFAHPDAGEKTLTDLNHAIESTITISRNEWKYVADVVTEFDPALPMIPLLPGEFNQVILNMIVNASHAIGDVIGTHEDHKGTITFRTRQRDGFAEIEIQDTGTGIPKEHLSKIFNPFFTTKKVGRGTGQGLAISHNVIVEKLKGTIEVKSDVGQGTTFILRLPINEI